MINLGTPDAPDARAVRRYLREFLSDRRVIEVNPLLWQVILNAVILPFRPRRSAEAYGKIWDRQRNESPLRTHTRAQAEGVARRLAATHPDVVVDWAMRYGTPSIPDRLHALAERGCTRILLFTLYPQYSATTTATAYDRAFAELAEMRWQPAVRTAPPYHDAPGYIAALAASVEAHVAGLGWQPQAIVASFHGLPKDYFAKGDPYYCHCARTARLLRERLGRDEQGLMLTFQSRFGPREWLQPYTEQTLAALPGRGVRDVAVITPGFAADCVETLEEIAIRGREAFEAAGGERFTVVPCLNAREDHVALLAGLVLNELSGWA
jgi:ferrochelatase